MAKTSNFEFPFFGAGIPSYFEFAEIHIWFKDEPSGQQKIEIAKALPEILLPSYAHDGEDADQEAAFEEIWNGRALTTGSDQFVNIYIEEKYGDPTAVAEIKDVDPMGFEASEKACKDFEADIEKSLIKINSISPILFAIRPVDQEAGGIEFSSWHAWSLKNANVTIAEVLKDSSWLDLAHERFFSVAFIHLLRYKKFKPEKLPLDWQDKLFPQIAFKKLLSASDPSEAFRFAREKMDSDLESDLFDVVVDDIKNSVEQHKYERAILIFSELINLPSRYEAFALAKLLAKTIVPLKDPKLSAQLHKALSNLEMHSWNTDSDSYNFAYEIGAEAFLLCQNQKWQESIDLFKFAMEIETSKPADVRLEFYCNALFPLQHDNSKLPVNSAQNIWFLDRCVPFAPKNPAIYFNAACLYVEMEDFTNAAEMVRQAKLHNYSGFGVMRTEMNTTSMFAKFRASQDYKNLEKN